MKTRELIKLLHKADPFGDFHVCIENVDIHYVDLEPAYYDGRQQILTRDINQKIVSAKINGFGKKVQIRTLPIEDAIFDNPNLPVEIESGNPQSDIVYKNKVERWRREASEMLNEMEYMDMFLEIDVSKDMDLKPILNRGWRVVRQKTIRYNPPLTRVIMKARGVTGA